MTAVGPAPLILTASLDPASQARFERERRQHFPSSLNIVPAHVTLFHHLPGAHADAIAGLLDATCQAQPAVAFQIAGIRFLGRGCAYDLDMPAMATLRRGLAAAWQAWLTPQDRQAWRPHLTIQNKASPSAARRLQEQLLSGLQPLDGMVVGLDLWDYLDGPWALRSHRAFHRGPTPA